MNEEHSGQNRRVMRILLVEDNKGDVILLKRAFGSTQNPPSITVARTGEEMLRTLEVMPDKDKPDIIILDLNLPGLSGHQVLRIVKSNEQLKRIPVFVFSSSLADSDISESYASYANCYIAKPHRLENLRGIVEKINQFWFSLAVLPSNTPDRKELLV